MDSAGCGCFTVNALITEMGFMPESYTAFPEASRGQAIRGRVNTGIGSLGMADWWNRR